MPESQKKSDTAHLASSKSGDEIVFNGNISPEKKALLLQLALEASADGQWHWDLEADDVNWSNRFKNILGYPNDWQINRQLLREMVHPDDRDETVSKIRTYLETGESPYNHIYRLRHADGSYRWIHSRGKAARNAQGKAILIAGAISDITDRIESDNKRREAEQFTRSMIDSSPDCIKVIDLAGRLISMNDEGCRQMEIEDFSVCVNQPWTGFWKGDDRRKAETALADACAGKTARFEGFCPTMKGTAKWWEVIVTPIRGSENAPAQLLSVSRDITDRKKLEKITKDAQEAAEAANMAKTEFLANMSHEIRTPMNAVIGLSTLLSKTDGLTAKQKDYIHTLQLSADSLLSLINDLLDISKIEARSIELEHIPFSITQMLHEVISMMSVRAKEKGLEFTASGECNKNNMLIGDPMRLRQIILNLCSNAIKFTDKGSVHVDVSCSPSHLEGMLNLLIAVKDTGIGIPPEKQDTIFQKFIQADSSISRKYGGTGLGLAITKTLTEIMDGNITISSVANEGSTFTVSLPMMVGEDDVVAQKELPAVPPVPEMIQNAEHRILLVEDYAANVLVAGSYLEHFGYSYDVVDNGYDAVEKAKGGKYLAILMDVQMHGINGFEATKLIRAFEKKKERHRTPIIGMTAHALTGDRDRCIAAGMDDYLSKPYNPEELARKLGDVVSKMIALPIDELAW